MYDLAYFMMKDGLSEKLIKELMIRSCGKIPRNITKKQRAAQFALNWKMNQSEAKPVSFLSPTTAICVFEVKSSQNDVVKKTLIILLFNLFNCLPFIPPYVIHPVSVLMNGWCAS
jgi:hypothetical protein